MPIWSNQIPDDPRGPSLPVLRTPPAKPLVAIVTCDDLLGCYTHYYRSRTMPCEGNGCEACNDSMPYRWHAYLSAEDMVNGLHFIFESTAQAAESFTTYRDAHGTLRGCLFEARRWHSKPNGRVLIRTKTANLTERKIHTPPDIKKCLAILWNLTDAEVGETRINPEKKTPAVVPKEEQYRNGNPLPQPDKVGTILRAGNQPSKP